MEFLFFLVIKINSYFHGALLLLAMLTGDRQSNPMCILPTSSILSPSLGGSNSFCSLVFYYQNLGLERKLNYTDRSSFIAEPYPANINKCYVSQLPIYQVTVRFYWILKSYISLTSNYKNQSYYYSCQYLMPQRNDLYAS